MTYQVLVLYYGSLDMLRVRGLSQKNCFRVDSTLYSEYDVQQSLHSITPLV